LAKVKDQGGISHAARYQREGISKHLSKFTITDHLEAANAAPRTIETYGLAVQQLGDYLRSVGMPLDPPVLTREHLAEFMRYLRTPKVEGGVASRPQRRTSAFVHCRGSSSS
jgi:hypothetical protein